MCVSPPEKRSTPHLTVSPPYGLDSGQLPLVGQLCRLRKGLGNSLGLARSIAGLPWTVGLWRLLASIGGAKTDKVHTDRKC